MKKILFIVLLGLTLASCGTPGPCNTCEKSINACEYDFSKYKEKTIESITYIDNGNDLIINFTDGETLMLHSYKYDIKVIEKPN